MNGCAYVRLAMRIGAVKHLSRLLLGAWDMRSEVIVSYQEGEMGCASAGVGT